jgi:hypothetical protein
METIYLDEIECPLCDRDTYCDSFDIEVHPNEYRKTKIKCDYCGGEFVVKTFLTVEVVK